METPRMKKMDFPIYMPTWMSVTWMTWGCLSFILISYIKMLIYMFKMNERVNDCRNERKSKTKRQKKMKIKVNKRNITKWNISAFHHPYIHITIYVGIPTIRVVWRLEQQQWVGAFSCDFFPFFFGGTEE